MNALIVMNSGKNVYKLKKTVLLILALIELFRTQNELTYIPTLVYWKQTYIFTTLLYWKFVSGPEYSGPKTNLHIYPSIIMEVRFGS